MIRSKVNEKMQNLIKDPTDKTPYVNFDANKGILELKGRSNPEDAIKFYSPLLDWMDEYIKNAHDEIILHANFEYFNTSSSKCILDLFKKIAGLKSHGKNPKIYWYCHEEDEDMQEAAEDYCDILKIPFEIITYQDEEK